MATVDRAVTYSIGLVEIIKACVNPKVGMVAGEKRVQKHNATTNDTGNEGLYWKYEAWLKRLDSEVSRVVATAIAMLSGSLLFLYDLVFAPIGVSYILFSLMTLVGIKKFILNS